MSIFSDRSYPRSEPPFGKIDGGVHPVVSLGNSFSLPIWNSLDIQSGRQSGDTPSHPSTLQGPKGILPSS